MKVDILAFGVHPDDVELSASGTLLKQIEAGYKVVLCDLTRGELGSRGNAQLRMKEAEDARVLMGALDRVNLGMPDGFFQHSVENILEVVRVIRRFQPEIVLANALSDRHPDHGRAARLVAEACFYAGLLKIETSGVDDVLQEPWRPKALYHYIQDRNLKADFVRCFSSQFYHPDMEGPETPISGKSFLEFLYAKNKTYGRDIGADYAEAFQVSRIPGVNDLFDLI
ncbi:MAG: bacillithiol biosynthesis deacetylase BshB1 [Saprospiraceae bacterium]|nr:bacillithiol biosynthesis deacetylase BshB1 [Saprospiraceae bacterium]